MGKIFYLIGKSSSGKDTIFRKLLKNKELNLQKIVTYTTRPKRTGETDGVEYHFISDFDVEELKKNNKIIELRKYYTNFGVWKYMTVNDDQIDLRNNDYLIIGTLESFLDTKAFFGEEVVIPIMITLDDGVRMMRALKRETKQKEPNYNELCRRFLTDDEDFSKENMKQAKIEKTFANYNLRKCISEIENYIKNELTS